MSDEEGSFNDADYEGYDDDLGNDGVENNYDGENSGAITQKKNNYVNEEFGEADEEEGGRFDGSSQSKYETEDADDAAHRVVAERLDKLADKQNAGDNKYLEYVNENLAEDFEDSPWVPPSLEVVSQYDIFKMLYKSFTGMGV